MGEGEKEPLGRVIAHVEEEPNRLETIGSEQEKGRGAEPGWQSALCGREHGWGVRQELRER